MSSTVAIIMRAKDEMPHVARSLNMLQRQTRRAFDLFAVDSGSGDGTLEALKEACPAACLTEIAPHEYVPGKVLNDAIGRTDHDIIVLLNADAVPLADSFLEVMLDPLLNNRADAVFAKQVSRPDARFVVAYDYRRAYDAARMEPDFFSAVACAFRRSIWEKHRFRETGYAEDLAWAKVCIADGARFRFVPEAVVEHSHDYPLKELYRKRRRQAETYGKPPNPGKQVYACLREILRDFLYACSALKLRTVPYNVAYRIVIHAATYAGLQSAQRPTCR